MAANTNVKNSGSNTAKDCNQLIVKKSNPGGASPKGNVVTGKDLRA